MPARDGHVAAAVTLAAVPSRRALWWLCGMLLGCGFVARLASGYDADELQHLHFAWNIGRGLVPYRDFFEHHPPALHYAVAPLVRDLSEAGAGVLVACRLLALLMLAMVLWGVHRLAGLSARRSGAVLAVTILLCVHPMRYTGFDMRPDGAGLACLLAALVLLVRSVHGRTASALPPALAAGLLAGTAACFTQKAAVLLPAAVLWLAMVGALSEDRNAARRGASALGAFLLGVAVPILAVALAFLAQGAARELLECTVLVNLRWQSEGTWRYTAQQSVLPGLPVYVLAGTEWLRVARDWRLHARAASPELLVATMLGLGVAALLRTPVPHPQSFAVYVVPWTALLAAAAAMRYAEDPWRLREDRPYLLVALALCLASLHWYNVLIASLAWGVMALLGRRWLSSTPTPGVRMARGVAVAIGPLAAVFVAGAMVDICRHEGVAQARVMRVVSEHSGPGTAVLQTWPLVAPFRRQPSYHGFAHAGLVETVGPKALQAEYSRVIRDSRAALLVGDRRGIDARLPAFASEIDRYCTRLGAPPGSPAVPQVYALRVLGGAVGPAPPLAKTGRGSR